MNGRVRDWRQTLFVGALVIGDVVGIFLCFVTAYWLRYHAPGIGQVAAEPGMLAYAQAVSLVSGIWLAIFGYFGLYELRRGWRISDLLFTCAAAVSLGMVFFLALSYLLQWFFVSRLLLIYLFLTNIVTMLAVRLALKRALMWAYRHGVGVRKMVVIGDTEAAAAVAKTVSLHPELGYRVVGALKQETAEGARSTHDRIGLRGAVAMFEREQVRDVVLTVPVGQNEELREFIIACQTRGIDVRLVPDLYELYSSSMHLDGIEGIPLLGFRRASLRGWERMAKRVLDVGGALAMLLMASPVWLIIAVRLRWRGRRPVIERHQRVGRMGREFAMLRFAASPTDGRWLSRYSLTELPQLLNVLRGNMSLVGPRPEEPARLPRYSAWHRRRLLVAPGITGLAQVNGLRGFDSTDEKTRFDLQYIERQSLLLDLKILMQTIWTLMRRDEPPRAQPQAAGGSAVTMSVPEHPRVEPC
ncbi:MAG TPA: sugar transferase [Candidatus Binatia bacterium]|nr:sugar transferase [Candidatus Binatia bacterium]